MHEYACESRVTKRCLRLMAMTLPSTHAFITAYILITDDCQEQPQSDRN